MARQHTVPLLLSNSPEDAIPLSPLSREAGLDAISEAYLEALVHAHPACLPIAEIDPIFSGAVPICTELNTPAGAIDNLLLTPSGLPVLVECKLWRNPEGRREVVGQILDYAKELSRWSSSDLQREVSRRLKKAGNPLLEIVRAADPTVDEIEFNDALTANLRRGRFLLLIVGDGIREGVEAITDYLQQHAGLHFSMGLVELPIFVMPDGKRLVAPRVLARTELVTRHVVAVPDGYVVENLQDTAAAVEIDPEVNARREVQRAFWAQFLSHVQLDDPEQPIPNPARLGYITFMLPASNGSSWLTVYRDVQKRELGIFLSSSRNSAGEFAMQAIADDWDNIKEQIGGTVRLIEREGRPCIVDSLVVGPLESADAREKGFKWLAERVNSFVNVLRPRVRSAAMDYQSNQVS